MNVFHVWIRSLGNSSRVRVEGNDNAQWLVGRLSRSFVFKSSQPMHQETSTLFYSFEVPYTSQTSRSTFEKLLATIPEVTLMTEPE
jgi:hypothetical protein